MFRDFKYDPIADGSVGITFRYDSKNRLAAIADLGGERASYVFDPLEWLIRRYGGQVVKSVPGDPGFCTSPSPAWTFGLVPAGSPPVYAIYLYSAKRLEGRDWQNDYSVSAGALSLAAEPAEHELDDDDWYKLGTVTLPRCESAVTLRFLGEGAAAEIVWLVAEGA